MAILRNVVDVAKFNPAALLPFQLRTQDFQMAMQDVYDFFYDVNSHPAQKGLLRLDDLLRPAIMSGVLSDMLTASLAKHSRTLTENRYFNGHPDLIVQGMYPDNAVKAGMEAMLFGLGLSYSGSSLTPSLTLVGLGDEPDYDITAHASLSEQHWEWKALR